MTFDLLGNLKRGQPFHLEAAIQGSIVHCTKCRYLGCNLILVMILIFEVTDIKECLKEVGMVRFGDRFCFGDYIRRKGKTESKIM